VIVWPIFTTLIDTVFEMASRKLPEAALTARNEQLPARIPVTVVPDKLQCSLPDEIIYVTSPVPEPPDAKIVVVAR
jgi:hypothetical protein